MERLLFFILLFLLLSPSSFYTQTLSDKQWKDWAFESVQEGGANLYRWKKEQEEREQNPYTDVIQEDLGKNSVMGYLIKCVGQCLNFREEGSFTLRYPARLVEGDEVTTGEDSYLWAFLMDGHLLRVGPHSSVTLKEIMVSDEAFFIEVRLNYGLATLLGRDQNGLIENNYFESDPLFLPLPLQKANPVPFSFEDEGAYGKDRIKEKLLWAIKKNPTQKKHKEELNKLVMANNEMVNSKKHYTLFVLPNVSLFGDNLSLISFLQLGEESFFHLLSSPQEEGQIFLRRSLKGDLARDRLSLEDSSLWYRVDRRGIEVEVFNEGTTLFGREMFFVSRPTSLLMAREIFLQEKSVFLYDKRLSPDYLFKEKGYRLWMKGEGGDILYPYDFEKRILFRKEFSTITEASFLSSIDSFLKDHEQQRKNFSKEYDESFYRKAFTSYLDSIGNRKERNFLLK